MELSLFMNEYQRHLYNNLMHLTTIGNTFYFQDFLLDDITYRIFNYRISSYTEFLNPSALECRGHMFEVDRSGTLVRLAALPMEKFHNLNECPFTQNLDLSTVVAIEHKADGSLISTFIHNGQLRVKSKGSLFSQQAADAMKYLDLPINTLFKQQLETITNTGITVNMEYVGPDNRIVLRYATASTIVLNARDTANGAYVSTDIFEHDNHHIECVNTNGLNLIQFVQTIPKMTESIEGFVLLLESGLRVKVKTDAYCALHHTKDSINNPRRLFECVVNEASDDLLSLFATDQTAIDLIHDMQERVAVIYNHMVSYVEKFYDDNKHLDRKDYAIKGRAEIKPQIFFGLVMNLYLEKSNDYKDFCIKHYKDFGFRDETTADL